MAVMDSYSKSRKVNMLIKLTVKHRQRQKDQNELNDQINNRLAALKGGQMSEYIRILKDLGYE